MSKNNSLVTCRTTTIQLTDGTSLTFNNVMEVIDTDDRDIKVEGSFYTYVVSRDRIARITTTEEKVDQRHTYQPIDFDAMPLISDKVYDQALKAWRTGRVGTAIALLVVETNHHEQFISKWCQHSWGDHG